MKKVLENTDNLTIKQQEVVDIQVENGKVKGVVTNTGAVYQLRTYAWFGSNQLGNQGERSYKAHRLHRRCRTFA